jgi:hypothetical protein
MGQLAQQTLKGSKVWSLISALFLLLMLWLVWFSPPRTRTQLAGCLAASYCIVWAIIVFCSRRHIEEVRKQFVTATVSLTLIVVLCEVTALAGFIDYRSLFRVTPRYDLPRNPDYELDDELLYKRRPYLRYDISVRYGDLAAYLCLPPQPVQPYTVKYDRSGFRNENLPEQADIAVIGDSFIEGSGVPAEALLTSVLGHLEHRVVINLGQGFYGPQQELIVLKRYGLPFRPRTVIWAIYEGNDLEDISRYERSRAEWQAIKQTVQRPWERSFTRNTLQTLLSLSQGCTPYPQYIYSGLFHDERGQPHRIYFVYPPHDGGSQQTEALDKLAVIIDEAVHSVRLTGADLVLLFIPTRKRVYEGFIDFASSTPKQEDLDGKLNIAEELPRRLLTNKTHVQFVDLTSAFRKATAAGHILYFPDDTHWTEEGHRIGAELIHEAIRKGAPTIKVN